MNHLRRFFTACVLAVIFAGFATFAQAQVRVDQPCGQGGTALRSGQATPVTLTDAQATAQQVRIRADGYWWTCETPGQSPAPVPCLLGFGPTAYLMWQVGPHQCRTKDPEPTGMEPGSTRELRSVWGDNVGQIRYHCKDGKTLVIGDPVCGPAPKQCVGFYTWPIKGKVYTYNANTAPVPVGQRVNLVAADGATQAAVCAPTLKLDLR